MAGIKAKDINILINGLNVSGQSNSVSVNVDQTPIEYDVFDVDGTMRLPQDPEPVIEHAGYFMEMGEQDLEWLFYDNLDGQDAIVTVVFGTKEPKPAAYTLINTFDSNMVIAARVGELITLNATWPGGANPLTRGERMYSGTKTAVGSLTVFDNLVTSTNKKAIVHVHSIVGVTSGVTILFNTDDNVGLSTPTAKGTLTFTDEGAQILDIAALERYVGASIGSLGGATSVALSIILGG